MTILDLVILPDDRLKTPVEEEIESIDHAVQNELDIMLETMYKYNGIGLASVQVGINKRMFVMDVPTEMKWELQDDENGDYIGYGGPYFIINPKIIELSDREVELEEGCLSIPNQRGNVTRPESLVLEYMDKDGEKKILKANKWLARCIQHEIDHINGIVFIDHFSKLKYDLAIKKAIKIKKHYIYNS